MREKRSHATAETGTRLQYLRSFPSVLTLRSMSDGSWVVGESPSTLDSGLLSRSRSRSLTREIVRTSRMNSGKWIRELREERFVRSIDIERVSRSPADVKGDPDFYVSHSTLADVETGAVPSTRRLVSLAVCLKVNWGMGPTDHLMRLGVGSKVAAKKRTAKAKHQKKAPAMKKGSHASSEERKRMKEAQLRARAGRLPYVTPEQLEACRLDPAWEARQGMANCVVCRECGAKVQSPLGGHRGHLWRLHQMTVRAYRAAYPGARARPDSAR